MLEFVKKFVGLFGYCRIFVFSCIAENNGRGKPQYEHDSDCTYRFTWATKYACLDHCSMYVFGCIAENNGRGKPQYEHDSDCTYRFTWATKYACLDHPLNEECRVNNDGNRYDLSALVRTQGTLLMLTDRNREDVHKLHESEIDKLS